MSYDGEWRLAFIRAEHRKLNDGTAPMPVANPKLYGSGYIQGTIIGIPQKRETRGRGVGSREVPDNERARARELVERPAQRAVHVFFAHVEGVTPDAHFATFLKIFGNKYSSTSPIAAAGVSYTNAVQNFATKWQAGKVSNLAPACKARQRSWMRW